MSRPCDPDHNGECLVCDCWLKDCAYDALFAGDFRYESFEKLLAMFEKYLTPEQVRELKQRHGQ